MKRIYFDTSVLVTSFFKQHPHFEASFSWVDECVKKKARVSICTHGLAELYSNLSRMHGEIYLSLLSVEEMIKQVKEHFKIIDLSNKDYNLTVQQLLKKNLRGPVIYDALHFQAALKAKAQILVTLNMKDYLKLDQTADIKLANPLEHSVSDFL